MSIDRRRFLQLSAALAGLAACKPARKTVPGSIVGANAATGHLLRSGAPTPHNVEERNAGIVIVGAGVSGLAAAWALQRQGVSDFVVLDLEDAPGGHARSGTNSVSAFPWGAHYVPTPNNNLSEYLAFLEEAGVVTGRDAAGKPVYNEYHLCFDPQERLFINGRWQEGLVPSFGVPDRDRAEIARFLELMHRYRHEKGRDGRDAFAIPLHRSSRDEQYLQLDRITFTGWMKASGFRSPYLYWYADYCTRDDFGTSAGVVSAWAGIHYFAARKGAGANAEHSDVLTWPEGNGFLVNALRRPLGNRVHTGELALDVAPGAGEVIVQAYAPATQHHIRYRCRQCVLAVPQFVAARLLQDDARRQTVRRHLHYAPWMVANLRVRELAERAGTVRSWDNVIYGSHSLGYVSAGHQMIRERTPLSNLTYYLPLTGAAPEVARREAYRRTHASWAGAVLADLEMVHPGIAGQVEQLDVLLWGHAMAQPVPGLLQGPVLPGLAQSRHPRVHFAHSDLAGISIFEEAFYQGIGAAEKIMQHG